MRGLLEAQLFSPLGQKRLDKRLAIGSQFLLKNSNIRDKTLIDRLQTLMHRLTDNPVLADLLDPVSRAVARVRHAAVGRTLTLPDVIALGVLRPLQGLPTRREQVQTVLHLDPEAAGAAGTLHRVRGAGVADPGGGVAGAGARLGQGGAAGASRSAGGPARRG